MYRIQSRIIIFILISIVVILSINILPYESSIPTKMSLDMFPERIGDWLNTVNTFDLSPKNIERCINRHYKSEQGYDLALVLCYWGKYSHGDDAFSGKYINPGWQWIYAGDENLEIDIEGHKLPVKNAIYLNGKEYMNIIYWYETDRGIILNGIKGRLQRGFDAILSKKTNVALIKVVTIPERREESIKFKNHQIQFIRELYPRLTTFLPFKEI